VTEEIPLGSCLKPTRCDVCFGPLPCVEHAAETAQLDKPPEGMVRNPLLAAARLMRDIHTETIKQVDNGFTYTRDGKDVSATMRLACLEEVERIDLMLASEPEFVEREQIAVGLYEHFINGVSQASHEAAAKGQLS
jgi:hypothetical protein